MSPSGPAGHFPGSHDSRNRGCRAVRGTVREMVTDADGRDALFAVARTISSHVAPVDEAGSATPGS